MHLHMHALVVVVLFACMNAEVVYFKHNLCYIILLCSVLFFYSDYQFHSSLFLIKANQVLFLYHKRHDAEEPLAVSLGR